MTQLAPSHDSEAPTPSDSGVDGAQLAGSQTDVQLNTSPPLEGQFLERTFLGLVADRPARFGGELNAPMIGAMINSISHEKEAAKQQVADLQAQINSLTAQLHDKEITIVKLTVQLQEGRTTNLIQKVCTFLCPVAISIAIDLYKSSQTSAALVAALGALLLMTNFIPKRGTK